MAGKRREIIEGQPLPALIGREIDFVAAYLSDPSLNQARAYMTAGLPAKDPKTAAREAYKMMQRPVVAAHIKAEMEKRAARNEITQDRVLAEIAKVAFLDPRKFFSDSGELIAIHELPADVAAALAGLDVVTVSKGEGAVEYVAKIKMGDKLKALELAGRHIGMFKDKVEHSGPDGGPIPVEVMPTDPIEAARAYQRLINGE